MSAMYLTTHDVLTEVQQERARQDDAWGEQNHDHGTWLAILTEELGEVAKEIQEMKWHPNQAAPRTNYRVELIQVAAVAVAMIEAHDRAMKKAGTR